MFKCFLKILFPFVTALLVSMQVVADSQADFFKANEYYQKQDYDNAIKLYENLVKSGNISAEVFYNLGNCYYKTGNVAKTILNYERALRLAPDDDDINFNLKIASLKVVDKIDAVPEIFYKRWIKDVASALSPDAWSKILLSCEWLLFLLLAMYVVTRSASLKKISFVLATVFFFFTIITFLLSEKSYSMTFVDQHAIVASVSVYVKSSPDEKGSDQFMIHEGTKVDVLDEIGDWKKVRIANGSLGWLKQNEIEDI